MTVRKIDTINANAEIAPESPPPRRPATHAGSAAGRPVRLSLAGALLASSAMVPLHAQTFDIGGGPLVVTDFTGPPLNDPTEITNGEITIVTSQDLPAYDGNLTDSLGVLSLTKDGIGTLTLTGANTYSGATTINGGTLQVGNGGTTGSLGGGGIINNAALVFNRSDDIAIGNFIVGSGSLVKRGAGALTLEANSFSGLISVEEGTLIANGLFALGDGSGGTVVADGATLGLQSNILTFGEITINGSGVNGGGALRNIRETSEIFGNISLGSAATITAGSGFLILSGGVNNGGHLLTSDGPGLISFLGGISGAGGFTKNGIGIVQFDQPKTYTGPTTINQGTLISRVSGLPDTGEVIVNGGALIISSGNETIGSLAGTGGSVTSSTATTLTVGGNNLSTTFAGVVGGALALTKIGTGTLTLTGANTYSGPTTINGGTLLVNGTMSNATAPVMVGDGGTLGGTGTIVGEVTVGNGGTLAAGQSPGTLTVGTLTLDSGSETIFELAQAGVAGGPNNDLIRVTGNLALNGGAISVVRGTGFGAGQYTLFEFGSLSGALGNMTLNPFGGGFDGSLAVGTNTVMLTVADIASRVHWNGSTTSATGGIVGGSGTWNLVNGNFTDVTGTNSGRWAGNGSLAIFGGTAGIVTIAPGEVLAPSGLTFLTDGYLIAAGDAAAGLRLDGPTGFETAAGVGAIISAGISGTGSLTKTGPGTLTLAGANTFAGPASVFDGTLQVTGSLESPVFVSAAALVNSGTINGLVTNNGTLVSTGTLGAGLVNAAGATASVSGVLTGPVSNSAALILTGATTGIGAFTQTGSGTFDLGGNSAGIGSLAGAGQVQLGSATLTTGSDNAATLFSGVIAGSGGLTKVGTGTLTLLGANTFTGLTTVSAGTLWLDLSGALAGGVINNAGFINQGGGVSGLFVNNGRLSSLVGLRGGLTNNTGARAVLGGGVDGDIINAGEVVLNPGARGIGSFTQSATGVFDLTRTSTAIGSLAGAGQVLLGTQTLIVGHNNASTSFAGAISGSGGLTKVGTGTLTLSGANTFTGLTTVSDGTLAITAGGALAGGVSNAGTLENSGTIGGPLDNSGVLVNEGSIAGRVTNNGILASTGSLGGGLINLVNGTANVSGTLEGVVENAGVIVLTGTTAGIGAVSQSASGVFDLAGNSTAIGSLAGAGSVVLGTATLTAGSDDVDSVYAGTISGAGSLRKVGNGALVLTGANTHAGGTTIDAGTLQLGDGGTTGSIIGPVANDGALVIARSDSLTLASSIGGTGMVVQAGTGTTTLTGTNSYAGGTVVSAGRLIGDTAALQGAIRNDAVLEFAMAGDGTFAGMLTGAGRVEKTGAGVLTYTGNGSTLAGPFAVLGGGLRLDGRLDSALVSLATGTRLTGNGVMGGLIVGTGATVAPGASLGLLSMAGDLTFLGGSRYVAEVAETGSDRIVAGGQGTLAGTLDVVNIGGANYRFNASYVVIESGGGLSGAFDAVTFSGFDRIYRPDLRTNANRLEVVLAPNSLADLAGAGLTANQAATAARFDAAVAAGFDPQAFFTIYGLDEPALVGALDQLSGEIHPAIGRAAMRQSRFPREAVTERAAAIRADTEQSQGFASWGEAFRGWGHVDGDGNAAAQDTDTEGFVVGVDGGGANGERAFRIGVFGTWLASRVRVEARGSSGRLEQVGGGAYASVALGGLSLAAGAGASRFDIATNRTVTLPGFGEALSGRSRGDMAQVFGRIGYRIDLGGVSLEPFASGDYADIALDSQIEQGGASAVAAGRQAYKVGGATVGLAGSTSLGALRLEAEAAARFELGDRDPHAAIALAAAPNQASRIAATRLNSSAFAGRLDAVLPITKGVEASLSYSGVFAGNDTEHAALAGLSIAF